MLTKTGLALLLAAASQAASALTVFACQPEWAALTRALLPEARIHVATTHLQDPHHIEARPSLIAQLRSADLAVCTGAELESGWLPMLQQRSANPRVQDGRPGMFYAAEQVELIDPFKGARTPFSGDVHAQGNPHFHADPRRLVPVAQALGKLLVTLQPDKAQAIEANQQQLQARLKARIADWEKAASRLRGREVVTQHMTFGYLWAWLGMKPIADLEPKPGMPPTAAHLEKTLESVRPRLPLSIVIAQHHDPRAGRWLESQTGKAATLLVLPATVTDEQPDALFRWFDQLIASLLNATKP